MKKVLSIAMAMLMMLAVCVPAFAADKTITDGSASKVDSGTVTVDYAGTATESYTITFPSTVALAWGDYTTTKADMAYKVDHTLKAGTTLKVGVTAANGGKMTADNGSGDTIQLVNDGTEKFTLPADQEFTGSSASTKTPVADQMTYIAKNGEYTGKTLDTYTATFTYTVTVTP